MRHSLKLRYVLLLALVFAMPSVVPSLRAAHAAPAGIAVSITIAPPVIPVYEQPPCPEDGYLWVPGYWAWGPDGYYWVPGVWVAPPTVGLLWTPGYWGFGDGVYIWHAGYWGPHVGFYGGIDYGFGYFGTGFYGGRWEGGHFMYNTAVVHVNTTIIRNVYVDRSVIHGGGSRVAFNGRGGVTAVPTAEERTYMSERHVERTSVQVSNQTAASRDRANFASVNHGRPANAAMARANATNTRAAENRAAANNHAAENRATTSNRASENRAAESRANESRANERSTSHETRSTSQPRNEERPSSEPRTESRPAAQPHNEARPEAQPRSEPHAAQPHSESHGESKSNDEKKH